MLYVIGFIVISVVAIHLNMKYYKLKGDPYVAFFRNVKTIWILFTKKRKY